MRAIVIGAGVIGCAVAYELSARGVACTILDERPIGGGATQASAGMLAPYVEAHERGPFLDLTIRSLGLYDDWITAIRHDSGLDVEYRRIGTLEIALDAARAADLRIAAEKQPQAASRWIDADATRQQFPALGVTAGSLFTPTHGYVAPAGLTAALAVAAERRGATFLRAAALRVTSDERGVAIVTSTGTLDCDVAVLAAGAWLNAIAVAGVTLPRLRPVRGQILQLGWNGDPLKTIFWGPECYIVPRSDGSILVGATVEEVGFDERATSAGVRDLLDAACELLPSGWGAPFHGVRVGLRPAAPDDLPVLGPDPTHPRIVHAYGHYRNGVLLAPVTAKLLADAIVDGWHDPALTAFRPDRFA